MGTENAYSAMLHNWTILADGSSIFLIDRNDLDANDDEIRLHDKVEEAARKASRRFEHREMASKCPTCNMVVTVRGKEACLASGKTITDTSGTGDCAYSPIRRLYDAD